MKKTIMLVLAALPLLGVLAVVSNGFDLDTRPSPQTHYGIIEDFSTFPRGALIIIR